VVLVVIVGIEVDIEVRARHGCRRAILAALTSRRRTDGVCQVRPEPLRRAAAARPDEPALDRVAAAS
jgi:hypothetical protein